MNLTNTYGQLKAHTGLARRLPLRADSFRTHVKQNQLQTYC